MKCPGAAWIEIAGFLSPGLEKSGTFNLFGLIFDVLEVRRALRAV